MSKNLGRTASEIEVGNAPVKSKIPPAARPTKLKVSGRLVAPFLQKGATAMGVYGDFAEIFPEKISTLQISRPESERFK